MYEAQQAHSFEEWQEIISGLFVPLTPSAVTPGGFTGKVSTRTLQELALTRVDAGAHSVERTAEHVGAGDNPYYKLNLQVSGHGLLCQDGRETVLKPGDLAIYDTQRPYTLTYEEEFSTLVLLMPQHILGLSNDDVSQLTAVGMSSDHRLCRAVSPFLVQLTELLPILDGPVAHRLATTVVDLVGTVLADDIYSRPGHQPDEAGRLMSRVQQFIGAQLANPELSPALVAQAHYMSTRTLHKLFEGSSSTVAESIRDSRLERCRRDLADPLHAAVPVSAIGSRWGMRDPAHFSRAFRARYGMSPAQYRKSMMGAGADAELGTLTD